MVAATDGMPQNLNSISWADDVARSRWGRVLEWRYYEDRYGVVRVVASLPEGPRLAFDGCMFFVGVVCPHGEFCIRASVRADPANTEDLGALLERDGMTRPPDKTDSLCGIPAPETDVGCPMYRAADEPTVTPRTVQVGSRSRLDADRKTMASARYIGQPVTSPLGDGGGKMVPMATDQGKSYEIERNQAGAPVGVGNDLQVALWRAHDIVTAETDVEKVAVYELRGPRRVYLGVVGSDGRLRRWINGSGS